MQTMKHHKICSHSQNVTTRTTFWDTITHMITFIPNPHGKQPPNLKIKQRKNIKLGDLIFQASTRTTVT